MNVFMENLSKQFISKFTFLLNLLALQQRHSYHRNVKRSDWFLTTGGVLIVKDETLLRL